MAKLTKRMIGVAERDEDGYWVYLKDGWCLLGEQGNHTIHEDTRAEAMVTEVELCYCDACVRWPDSN
jgi:hypothetical protein